jgi:hypothetical protein
MIKTNLGIFFVHKRKKDIAPARQCNFTRCNARGLSDCRRSPADVDSRLDSCRDRYTLTSDCRRCRYIFEIDATP